MRILILLFTVVIGFSSFAQSTEVLATRTLVSNTALQGITATWSEYRPYYCSRFVRQVMQKAFPLKADEIAIKFFGLTANDTENKWKAQGKLRSYSTVFANGNLREGDVVFQAWNVEGHVGVVVRVNGVSMIAENTIRYGLPLADHRALTTLAKFGPIRSVGRYTGFNF